MVNQTRFKVEEASYFLYMMKQTFNEESNNCIYNFNAFLSAARSITYFMQQQYCHQDGFIEWYCDQQVKMKKDQDLIILNKARVDIIHKKPIATILEFTLIPIPNSKVVKDIYEKMTFNVDKRAFQINGEEIDIIKFSETQLNKLIRLVEECERRFIKGNSNDSI